MYVTITTKLSAWLSARLSAQSWYFEPSPWYWCCEQQRERAAQPSEEPQRGVNSLDGKVKETT